MEVDVHQGYMYRDQIVKVSHHQFVCVFVYL